MQLAKGEGTWYEGTWETSANFQSLLSMESHRTRLIPQQPGVTADVKCRPGTLIRDSKPRGFIQGLLCWHTLLGMYQHSSRKAGVQQKSLGTGSPSDWLENAGHSQNPGSQTPTKCSLASRPFQEQSACSVSPFHLTLTTSIAQ